MKQNNDVSSVFSFPSSHTFDLSCVDGYYLMFDAIEWYLSCLHNAIRVDIQEHLSNDPTWHLYHESRAHLIQHDRSCDCMYCLFQEEREQIFTPEK